MISKARHPLPSSINNLIILILITGCSEQLAKSHFTRGEVYWRRGDSYSAIKELKTALKYNPSDGLKDKILILISTVASGQIRDSQTAIWANEERLKVAIYDNAKFDIYLRVAEIYESHLKRHEKAIDTYHKILELFPQHKKEPDIRLKIAENYINMEKYEKAKQEINFILSSFSRSPIMPRTLYQMGNILYLQEDYSRALKYFGEVIKKYPGDETTVFARFGMGNCLEEEDKLKKAISIYKLIKQQYPNQPIITHRIARLEKRVKRRGR